MPVRLNLIPAINRVRSTIGKFQKVDEFLYRGALPKPEELMELKRQGIEYIINLRTGHSLQTAAEKATEKAFVERLGLKFIEYPIDSRKGPTKELINDFFEFSQYLRNNNKKAFIHCKHGKDRTGTMVALYELNFGVKNYHQALQEYFGFGYNHSKHPHLLRIVQNFAREKNLIKV